MYVTSMFIEIEDSLMLGNYLFILQIFSHSEQAMILLQGMAHESLF